MKIVQVESLGVSKQELDEAKQEFEKLGHQYIYYTDIPKGEDELIARMKDADIVNISNIKLTARAIVRHQPLHRKTSEGRPFYYSANPCITL